VFDGGGAEGQEVGCAGQVLAEPSAEWVSARFSMEEAPGLSGRGVLAFVGLAHQVVTGTAFVLLGAGEVKSCWCSVGLLVDLVDDTVANGHCVYLG